MHRRKNYNYTEKRDNIARNVRKIKEGKKKLHHLVSSLESQAIKQYQA